MSAMSNMNLRMQEGALNYARADKSDPFALVRAIAHMKNGVASINNDKQQPGYYDAEPYEGTRKIYQGGVEIGEVKTTLYRGMCRP